ncbi:MAG: hypothetical protein KDK70_25640, partial [Myxococcales bacterium]|nr:hypothetical protein [Myxococcales bacterium]
MSGDPQTYLAHLSTMGIDATQLSVDRKGTLSASTLSEGAPRPTARLPRLIVGSTDDQGTTDLELEDPLG